MKRILRNFFLIGLINSIIGIGYSCSSFKNDNNLDSIKSYSKPILSKIFFESTLLQIKYYYDENEWYLINPKIQSKVAEFALQNKTDKIICIAIPDNYEISLKDLTKNVSDNLQKGSSGMKILINEKRKVNDQIIAYLKASATINNENLIFSNYLYSDKNGSIQYLCACTEDIYKRRSADIEALLNGLVIEK